MTDEKVEPTNGLNLDDFPEPLESPEDIPEPIEVEETSGIFGMGRWLLETILMVALAFLLAQGIKTFVIQPFVVPTGSMEPTIMTNDRVLAEKFSYRFDDPEPGDIVVFDDPAGRHPQLIKRVIAVGGQTLDIADGHVYIDGELLDEPYLVNVETAPGTEPLPVLIPDDYVWVMGDNRPNSGDSRFIGPQPIEAVNGRAFGVYWPLDRIGALE